MDLFEVQFCLDTYPEVGLLDHMRVLFLVFRGTFLLFTVVAAPSYIGSPFSFFSAPLPLAPISVTHPGPEGLETMLGGVQAGGFTRLLALFFISVLQTAVGRGRPPGVGVSLQVRLLDPTASLHETGQEQLPHLCPGSTHHAQHITQRVFPAPCEAGRRQDPRCGNLNPGAI